MRQLLFWSGWWWPVRSEPGERAVPSRARWLARPSPFALVLVLCALLGGHQVEVDPNFPDHTPYIGMDWFILDLLGSALIFIFIEKLFALRKDQPVFRPEWQTDFHHFIVNHMVIGFMLLATNLLVHNLFGWAAGGWRARLDRGAAVLGRRCRSSFWWQTSPSTGRTGPTTRCRLLWRLHAVHHSTKHMDWMAGSRQHMIWRSIITRTLVLGADLHLLGFSKEVIDAYIIVVGFQAVFNHANVSVRLGPLRYLIVTPNFHHWHHSQDQEALDKQLRRPLRLPRPHLRHRRQQRPGSGLISYGVLGDYVPEGLPGSSSPFPFTWKG